MSASPAPAAKKPRLARLRSWYAKFEGPFSSLSLIGGFVFDAITLKRVDMFWENFWVIAHLLIVTTCMILANVQENEGGNEANPEKIHFWLVNIIQFFFGGILSTYLVFYFRSGTLSVSWPFILVLFIAFAANERLKRHYTRLVFQVSLLFLSFYTFAIYIIPVLFHQIGAFEFLVSGAASLAGIMFFLVVLATLAKEKFTKSKWPIVLAITIILVSVNLLYFAGFIPPIPLSLKDNGLYHSLAVNAPGHYTVTEEDQGPLAFFKSSSDIHLLPGDPLYAYSAIFSPTSFSLSIVHEWQHYDTAKGAWVTRGRIVLPVIGGGDGGYRTFSMEEGLAPGAWRINVLTPQGQTIGRINFTVTIVAAEPALRTRSID